MTALDAVKRGLALEKEARRERADELRADELRADELRAVEVAKLDAAAEAIWPLVEAGDLRAQVVWLRNRGRFADLLGLYMRSPTPDEAAAVYSSPILDDIARRAVACLALAGLDGMTVKNLAARIKVNPSTVGNVLRGASVAYGSTPFVRAGKQGDEWRWRARRIGDAS